MHAKEAGILGCCWQVIQSAIFHFKYAYELQGISISFFIHLNRAKYDAWKVLGKMPRERAMELYVDELKKIIETMSYTDNVAEFMDSISELDGVDVDDLEAVAPEAIKKVRSQPNSPFGNDTNNNETNSNSENISFANKYTTFAPCHIQRHENRVRSELHYEMASKMDMQIQMDLRMEMVRIYKMVIPMQSNIPTMNTSTLWR